MKKLCTLVLGLALLAGCGGSGKDEVKKVCKLDMGMAGVEMKLTAKGEEEEIKKLVFDVDFDVKEMNGVDLSALGDKEKDKMKDAMEEAMTASITANFGTNSDAVDADAEIDGNHIIVSLTMDGDKLKGDMEKMSMDEFAKMVEKDMNGSCK